VEAPSFTSLIPIFITLLLSLYTRNVVIGLFVGVVSGVAMIEGLFIDVGPLDAFGRLISGYIVPQVTDSYNAGVIVLLVFIGGFVLLVEQSGGGNAFASSMVKWVKNKLQASLAAWAGGIVIFFSDLGTPLIVGPVFRPLFDKLKMSRQKLAFIIDSTSSPVAIMIPFIGWGVYIMGIMQKEFDATDYAMSDWDAFIGAIPYQFYAILAVGVVPLIALFRMDFGPMARAEASVVSGENLAKSDGTSRVFTHPNAKASFVFLPLIVMLSVMLFMLVPQGFPFERVSGSVFRAALSSGYFFAAITLMGLMAFYGVRKLKDNVELYLKGMSGMMSVAVMLVLAWTLSAVGKELGTAAYIAELAQAGFPSWLLPAAVFIVAGIISFATGSSWGTFAILMPIVIPTALAIDSPMLVAIGAVLSGGLFGDHCSPISETTILSSTGAECDQFEHVRTQFPYALTNGGIALACFIVAGVTDIPFIFAAALLFQIAVFFFMSRYLSNKH